MPDAVELPLTLPAELGSAVEVLGELRDRVRAVEVERAAERVRTGRRVLGRRAVLAQSWHESPRSVEPRRNLRPRVASRNKWARIETLLRNRALSWSTPLPAIDGETAFLPCSQPAPTGSSGSRRCQCSKHDSSRSLKIAQSIAARDVPTPPGASGAWSRPGIGVSTSKVLLDRGRGPSAALGL